ncbi:MAG: WecB/TagA/CpsF family glycosyltransferase [Phototrophicales bacterium]|nr:WecB/TagA/CpsF family glycosyltransferase [Phototrophicales bacterium]
MTRLRFLIIQTGDIGDLIVSTPALCALREAHPTAHITLMTTSHSAPVVTDTGLVDEIIPFDRSQFNSTTAFFRPKNLRRVWSLRKNNYDAVLFFRHFTLKLGTLKFAFIGFASRAKKRIGLQNGNGWFLTDSLPDNGFGAKHEAQYWLELVGLVGGNTTQYPTKVHIGASPLPKPHGKKRMVIHAGSGGYSRARRWDVENFALVADELHARYDAQIVIVGGKGDDGIALEACMTAPAVNLTGQTSLAELAGVIADADVYIGSDSGVMHLASAVGVPMVALFGPSNHRAWGAWSPNGQVIIVRGASECSPCSYVGHGIGSREGCVARTCMKLITPQHVLDAVNMLINTPPTPHYVVADDNPLSFSDRSWTRQTILGLPVDGITYDQWMDTIDGWITHSTHCHHVCTTNPEFMMIAQKDTIFAGILRRASICVPDGVGLLWAAKRLGTPLPQRVTGSDGVPRIAEEADKRSWKLFFLGAGEGIAQKAADILQKKHPNLQIVGIYGGSPAPDEEEAIVQMVNDSGADILFVAYGAPKQDLWIARNLPRLQTKMAMGIGGSFDFIAGIVPRAPVWMRNYGLEWLYRLYLQPSRMGRMTRLPRFVWAVIRRGRR